jgi:hypothetical protein
VADIRRSVRDQGFEPLECSIPAELTIAEYRSRRAGEGPATRPERRAPRLRVRALIRR